MPSRLSVPRIRVDLADSSPRNLPPSSTLDIKDILGQAKLLPKLLAEYLVLDSTDDALYFENGCSQNFPSFPTNRRPPLFILDSHHARLPFPLRMDAFEICDLFSEEGDACPLPTIPTIPRMRRVMREQLYVQKWVDALTPDNPPKHIPWTCEKPATRKKWVAEGSIFLADVVKTGKFSTGQRGAIQERLCVDDTGRLSILVDGAPHSQELCTLSEVAPLIHATTEPHASTPVAHMKSADDGLGNFRGEARTLQAHHRRVRISQASSPPILLPSVSSMETTSNTPYAPLAARRGKTLSALKLRGRVIEPLEYPDIPTAFRGSMVWSPPFGTFPIPYFTDHECMVSNLNSKCAALGSGVSTCIQQSRLPKTGPTGSSLSIDEWAFTRGLATFDNSFLGSIECQVSKEITTDMSIFLPDASPTPVKGPNFTHPGFVSCPHSTPAPQSPGNRSSDPPGVPLPPRPALVNPSTPPHVRGILKKTKSVRFEDTGINGSGNLMSPVILPPKASLERSSPSISVAPSVRPCTPIPNTTKSSTGPRLVGEALRRNTQTKSSPRPRPPPSPKRTKANEKLGPTPPNLGHIAEPPKLTSATSPIEYPCQVAHVEENANPTVVPLVQAKRKGVAITEIDVRKGVEGTTKSRLSTPLRNIFRFR